MTDMTADAVADRWKLTLYVNGASANSIHAIETARRVCDEDLSGRVDLEIIDVSDHPALVLRDQVFAAPTLIKRLPGPLRRIVGDLSDPARLRVGLELRQAVAEDGRPAMAEDGRPAMAEDERRAMSEDGRPEPDE